MEELDGRPSSAVIADALPAAALVKAFNHLPARTLAEDPEVEGGRRVPFLSSDDDAVGLGKLDEGGQLIQARGETWAPLIFQDLFKKEASAAESRGRDYSYCKSVDFEPTRSTLLRRWAES